MCIKSSINKIIRLFPVALFLCSNVFMQKQFILGYLLTANLKSQM